MFDGVIGESPAWDAVPEVAGTEPAGESASGPDADSASAPAVDGLVAEAPSAPRPRSRRIVITAAAVTAAVVLAGAGVALYHRGASRPSLRETAQAALTAPGHDARLAYLEPNCRELIKGLASAVGSTQSGPETILSVTETGDSGVVQSVSDGHPETTLWEFQGGKWLMTCADLLGGGPTATPSAAPATTPVAATALRDTAQRAIDATRGGDAAALLPFLEPRCRDTLAAALKVPGAVATPDAQAVGIASVSAQGDSGTVMTTLSDGSTKPQSWVEVAGQWLLSCGVAFQNPGTTSADAPSSGATPASSTVTTSAPLVAPTFVPAHTSTSAPASQAAPVHGDRCTDAQVSAGATTDDAGTGLPLICIGNGYDTWEYDDTQFTEPCPASKARKSRTGPYGVLEHCVPDPDNTTTGYTWKP